MLIFTQMVSSQYSKTVYSSFFYSLTLFKTMKFFFIPTNFKCGYWIVTKRLTIRSLLLLLLLEFRANIRLMHAWLQFSYNLSVQKKFNHIDRVGGFFFVNCRLYTACRMDFLFEQHALLISVKLSSDRSYFIDNIIDINTRKWIISKKHWMSSRKKMKSKIMIWNK